MTMRSCLGLAPVLCLLAVGLDAQTLPVPSPPPEIEPSPIPSPVAGRPGTPPSLPVVERPRLRAWEFETSVGAGWDSNLDFTPDGPESVAVIPRAALARVLRGPRGELRIEARGRWIGYVEHDQQSRGYGRFDIGGKHQSSPSTTWRGSGSYDFGYTDSSQPLIDQGVLVPVSRVHTITGNAGVTRQMGARTSFLLDGRAYSTFFDTPGLIDGTSVRGTATLEQRFSPRSTGALVYAAEYVTSHEVVDGSYLIHFGSLQWSRFLTPRTGVLLEAGAGYTADPAVAGLDSEWSFFGGLSLTRQLGRSSLVAFVRREVVPALGTGSSRPETRAGLRAGLPLGRSWELSLAASHIVPDSPENALTPFPDADEASLALKRHLGGLLSITAEGSYRRRGPSDPLPEVEAFNAGVYLTLASVNARPKDPIRPGAVR